MSNKLDAFTARQLFSYNPATGLLIWKSHPNPAHAKRWIGKTAGTIGKTCGYRRVYVFGERYQAHRIIYLIMMGHFPASEIDHKNRDKLDNRWCNLRNATRAQNEANGPKQRNNSTGFRGVSFHRGIGKYQAYVKHRKKQYFAGWHPTGLEAKNARDKLARQLHGEFFSK